MLRAWQTDRRDRHRYAGLERVPRRADRAVVAAILCPERRRLSRYLIDTRRPLWTEPRDGVQSGRQPCSICPQVGHSDITRKSQTLVARVLVFGEKSRLKNRMRRRK
jgi:hypothetical protein